MSRYYHVCCENVGRPICIRTVDGVEYRGIIQRVTQTHVYLEPIPGSHAGYGYGFWGYGRGLGLGIALGAIGTLAFLPFFFI